MVLDCFLGLWLQMAGPLRTARASVGGGSGSSRCCGFLLGGVRCLGSGVSDLLSLGLVGLSPALGGKVRGRRLGPGGPILSIRCQQQFLPPPNQYTLCV